MDQDFVIACDLGTSGVKAALVNMLGEIFETATASYPLYVAHEGWAEQNPELYWNGVCQATQQVISASHVNPANAKGLAFCTQWKGIIPIDRDGHIMCNSIIWLDSRAGEQADRLNAHFGQELFCASDYWPKLMWFRENCPDIYEKAEIILEANSFLKWKTTGVAAMDVTNCFVRSADPKLQSIYNEILHFANIDLKKFPEMVNTYDIVGHVTQAAAEELGLAAGIPVFGGCCDIPAIAIGSGSAKAGGAHIYLGTSGWIGYSVPHTEIDFAACPLSTEEDICQSGMNAVGLAFNWAINRLYPREVDELGGGIYDFINAEIASAPAGSAGLICTPWFYGECEPLCPEVRGTFFGLGDQHTRKHMVRAVLEGICYSLKYADEQYRSRKGLVRQKEYYAIGGGSLSPVWMQMLADILNMPINVPRETKHTGAIGAAYCALVGLGRCTDYGEASQNITVQHRYEPIPEHISVYADGYARFNRLREAIIPLFTA